MLENICVLNHYCKLVKKERKTEKKRKEKENLRKKKKHVKHVIKSNQLVHFCLTMSSVPCADEPSRQRQR